MKSFIKKLVLISLLTPVLNACNTTETKQIQTPEDIYDKYKKSVVLVYNKYYFEVTIQNKKYYVGYDQTNEGLKVYSNVSDASKNTMSNYGTGFFISKDGLIASNRHVVQPTVTDDMMRSINYAISSFSSENNDRMAQDKENLDSMISELEDMDSNNQSAYQNLKIKIDNLKKKITLANTAYVDIDEGISLDQIKIINAFVGVAYEDETINDDKNYHACKVIRVAKDEEIDLSLIQLTTNQTPSEVKNIFNFDENNVNIVNKLDTITKPYNINNRIKINTKVTMIGYNDGMNLAKLPDGIKPQLTQGTISQESNGFRVLYSIPSLPGSSGSPIVDEWGNLIAINYAGLTNTQSFNYGILAKHLKSLIDGKISNFAVKEGPKASQGINISANDNPAATAVAINEDANAVIRGFLEAENDRDFEEIYSYFAPTFSYWDLKNASKEQLKNRYATSWSKTKEGSNAVDLIESMGDNSYVAKVIYSYVNNNDELKTVQTFIKFTLNNNNKIININKLK